MTDEVVETHEDGGVPPRDIPTSPSTAVPVILVCVYCAKHHPAASVKRCEHCQRAFCAEHRITHDCQRRAKVCSVCQHIKNTGGACDCSCHDEEQPNEAIDHPSHYGGKSNPYEAIKVIEALGWGEGFNRGNALKYLIRAGKKKGAQDHADGVTKEVEDLRKAAWYLDREIERLGATRIKD